MNNAERLLAARALIKNGWTQHWFARDSNGQQADIHSPDACLFCAEGAIARVIGKTPVMDDGLPYVYLKKAAIELSGGEIRNAVAFNDDPDTTHADVLALYDRAIVLAEAEGA